MFVFKLVLMVGFWLDVMARTCWLVFSQLACRKIGNRYLHRKQINLYMYKRQ
jgi:hypothetical protein